MGEDHLYEELGYTVKGFGKVNLENNGLQVFLFKRVDGFPSCTNGFMNMSFMEEGKLFG